MTVPKTSGHTVHMETNNAPTYADYLAYVATLNTEVDAYTEKQWDTMPSANKFGLNVLIRRQRAGKALSV